MACDLAAASPGAQLLLPCIDAGKGQVYARMYDATIGAAPCAQGTCDWVVAPDTLCGLVGEAAADRALRIGGTGVNRYVEVFRSSFDENVVRWAYGACPPVAWIIPPIPCSEERPPTDPSLDQSRWKALRMPVCQEIFPTCSGGMPKAPCIAEMHSIYSTGRMTRWFFCHGSASFAEAGRPQAGWPMGGLPIRRGGDSPLAENPGRIPAAG